MQHGCSMGAAKTPVVTEEESIKRWGERSVRCVPSLPPTWAWAKENGDHAPLTGGHPLAVAIAAKGLSAPPARTWGEREEERVRMRKVKWKAGAWCVVCLLGLLLGRTSYLWRPCDDRQSCPAATAVRERGRRRGEMPREGSCAPAVKTLREVLLRRG